MREIWIADAETDPFQHGAEILPFIWGAYNGTEYHEFTDTREFVDFFADKKCIVYAHNGGKFDWHFLLEWIEPFSPVMVISGRLAKFKIGDAEFRDSYNILPSPLSAYKKDEIDYSKFTRENRNKYMPEIRDYLRSDCIYLYEYVKAFIDRYGLNLTFAGAAMKVWQELEDIKAPETSSDFYHTFEPYYYGGRVQAFHLGQIDGDFKIIDINSAYPFAMKHVHPYGDTYEESDTLPSVGVERCFITCTAASRGAFPFRSDDGSLEFPDDNLEREFHVTGWEYLASLECGTYADASELRISRVIQLPLTIQFDKYIDHFSAEKIAAKESGDTIAYLFAKFFLNGLYGKFAANPEKYSEYMVIPPENIEGAMIHDGYDFSAPLGPWALMARDLPEQRQRFYNLAVGASITGFVRAYLYRAIKACKGVLYCDTDSITCRDTGNLELHPTRLGAWDLEAECDYGGIGGKKLYAKHKKDGGWKIASKGARLTPAELMQIASGATVEYKSESPTFSIHNGKRYITRRIKRKDVAKDKKRA